MSINGFTQQWHDDGEGNKIHESAVINWERVSIGSGNEIGPGVCIGTDAQHRTEDYVGEIIIGDNNIIRAYTTINLPTLDSSTLMTVLFALLGMTGARSFDKLKKINNKK